MRNIFGVFVIALVLGAVLGVALGVPQGWAQADSLWRKDMVVRGYGQYCPLDGHFAFNGECSK